MAEEFAHRRAHGAVARIASTPACWSPAFSPSCRSPPPPRRSTSSTTSSTWRSTGRHPTKRHRPFASGAPVLPFGFAAIGRAAGDQPGRRAAACRSPPPRRPRRLSSSPPRPIPSRSSGCCLSTCSLWPGSTRCASSAAPPPPAPRCSFWLLAFSIFFFLVAGAGEALCRAALDAASAPASASPAAATARRIGDHRPGRHGLGLLGRAGAGPLHRQRGRCASSCRTPGSLAGVADRALLGPCASGSWRGATRCTTTRSSSSSATGAASWWGADRCRAARLWPQG